MTNESTKKAAITVKKDWAVSPTASIDCATYRQALTYLNKLRRYGCKGLYKKPFLVK